jgi:hypothetical protein
LLNSFTDFGDKLPEKMNQKRKLFHYTSINNLAQILKSKSIRFGRLDNVNDPTEGSSCDFHSFSPYIFISCWTENSEENLALWNMYTPKMRGVRIELELPIFLSNKIEDLENFLFSEAEYLNDDKGYFILSAENEPYNIVYTDDENLLKPAIRSEEGLKIGDLAKYKRLIWEFEQECRFRLDIIPIDKNFHNDYFPSRYQNLIDKQIYLPFDGYLIKIIDDSFKKMRISCSPKLQSGDIEIIEALVNTFNSSATIIKSGLTGLIK